MLYKLDTEKKKKKTMGFKVEEKFRIMFLN